MSEIREDCGTLVHILELLNFISGAKMYNSQTCPLGALHPPSLPGPGVVHELCVMRTCEGFVARYLFYATTSLLSALILSSYCGKASFSAYSIYLGSSNRNSKFKC